MPLAVQGIRPSFFISLCAQKIKTSKWTDVALMVSGVALLVIGILASVGLLNSMGAANALFLSYGMYCGAALLFLAEIIKVSLKFCSKKKQSQNDSQQAPVSPKEPTIDVPKVSTVGALQNKKKPKSKTASTQIVDQNAIQKARELLNQQKSEPNFHAHEFVQPINCSSENASSWAASVEKILEQPTNQEIALLYCLLKKICWEKIKMEVSNCAYPCWNNPAVLRSVDDYMKVCYAISCLTLDEVTKNKQKPYAKALLDENNYVLQTFALIHDEFVSLESGLFWERFKGQHNLKNNQEYKKAFYKAGAMQNSWRLLSNDFCQHLSRLTTHEALYDAGCEDRQALSFKGRAFIHSYGDKKDITLFSHSKS